MSPHAAQTRSRMFGGKEKSSMGTVPPEQVSENSAPPQLRQVLDGVFINARRYLYEGLSKGRRLLQC